MSKIGKLSTIYSTIIALLIIALGLSFYFTLHPQLETPTSAATVTEEFEMYRAIGTNGYLRVGTANVEYNNIYGSIESVEMYMIDNIAEVPEFVITVSLNSSYTWSTNACTISINCTAGTDDSTYNCELNRNDNEWGGSAHNIMLFIITYNWEYTFTFPFEELVTSTTYSITYNLNGGSYGSSHPSSYDTSSSQQTLTVSRPTRAGYTFRSWTLGWGGDGTSPTINGTTLTIPANTTGDITLTANWTRASYSISYTLNGGSYGSSHPSSYTTSASQQTITISNPTRGGYTFSSWTISRSSSGGSSPYFSGTRLRIPANSYGNITLTANWTARSYTISVNANGGNISGSPPTTYSTSTSAQTFSISNPTRDYYNFTGWTLTRGGTYGGNSPTISNDTLSIPANSYGTITLTAGWEIQKFNLTFRSNNTGLGYVTPAYESSPQNALASYSSTATPTHPLAEFLWWTDENGNIISYEETITIPSLTANTVRIAVFRANGTAVTAYNGGEVRAQSNGDQITLTAVAYTGCEFTSWVVTSGSLTLNDPTADTITLPLATLNGVVLSPTFTGGDAVTNSPMAQAVTGGEVRMNLITINDTDHVHLSAIALAGYTFTGWTAKTTDGATIDLSTYGATCDIPLSQIEGAIIIANFTAIDSTNHNPDTDNSNGEFE